jgi:hypothetical protein
VTVGDWIRGRTERSPAALTREILVALGADSEAPAARTAELCLAAAQRSLAALIDAGRFAREYALELLAIDALTTFAFDHASESGAGERLGALAKESARSFGQLTGTRG